jgi:hypothetical protein
MPDEEGFQMAGEGVIQDRVFGNGGIPGTNWRSRVDQRPLGGRTSSGEDLFGRRCITLAMGTALFLPMSRLNMPGTPLL